MNKDEMYKMWEAAADCNAPKSPKADPSMMSGPKKEIIRDPSLRARSVREKASEDRKRNGQ